MSFPLLTERPNEPPFVAVHFNSAYLPMLLSVLQDLERSTIYEGTEENKAAMVVNAEWLQILFMEGVMWTQSGCPIGMLAPFPTLLSETSGWLPCDAATWYDATDYPLLWQYLTDAADSGYDYAVTESEFRTPNINPTHRAIIGAEGTSVYMSGMVGGEATHALTSAENAPHSHNGAFGYNGTGSNIGVDVGEIANYGSASQVLPTSTSGSGTPHNNMPPFLCMYWHISAK